MGVVRVQNAKLQRHWQYVLLRQMATDTAAHNVTSLSHVLEVRGLTWASLGCIKELAGPAPSRGSRGESVSLAWGLSAIFRDGSTVSLSLSPPWASPFVITHPSPSVFCCHVAFLNSELQCHEDPLWLHRLPLANSGLSFHLNILNLVTSAKSLLPGEATNWSVPGIRTRTTLGGGQCYVACPTLEYNF